VDPDKLIQELKDDYCSEYILEDAFKTDRERSAFIWGAARDGELEGMVEAVELLHRFPEAADAGAAVGLLRTIEPEPGDDGHRGVKGWDYRYEELLELLAERQGRALLEVYTELPDPIDDLAAIALFRRGLLKQASEKTVGRLAVAHLECSWDDEWLDVRRRMVSDEVWTELLLARAGEPGNKISRWERVKELAARATPEQKVGLAANNADNNRRAVALSLLLPLGAEGIPLVEQALASLPFVDTDPPRPTDRQTTLALAAAVMRGEAGMDIPAQLDPFILDDLTSYTTYDLDVLRRALAALGTERSAGLIRRALKESSFSCPRAIYIVDAVAPDATTLDVVLEHAQRVNETDYKADALVKALGAFGAPAAGKMVAALAAKPKNVQAEIYVRALGEIGAAQGARAGLGGETDGLPRAAQPVAAAALEKAAAALVNACGHGTKGVRAAAVQALKKLGPGAHEAIARGTKARKKAVRETCEQLLGAVGEQGAAGGTPLAALHEKARALPQRGELVEAMAACREWTDRQKLDPLIEEHGALLLAACRDWLVERANDYRARGAWTHALEKLSGDAGAAWVAVDAYAALPKMSSYSTREITGPLGRFGELLVEPIAHALEGPPPVHRADLYELLSRVNPAAHPEVWLRGLRDSQKTVRDLSLQALQGIGPSVENDVLALLSEKKKALRLTAAELLAGVATEGSRAAIEKALKKEKAADVAAALERALSRAGGTAHAFPEGGDEAAVDAFLAGFAKGKPPKFLDGSVLPALSFRSGTALSREAALGLLMRLRNEGPETRDGLAREARATLDDASCARWSVAVLDAWEAASSSRVHIDRRDTESGPSKEKWAVYQQAVMADEERLNEVAPKLDWMTSFNMHHLAGWTVDVLARHASTAGPSWVAYWARHAERDSLQSRARAALEELARAAGKTVEVYAAGLNPFIHDDVSDRRIPGLGFEDGPIQELDYGARKLEAFIGADLGLRIRDAESGKEYKSAPKAGKSDDAARAKEARERYSELKKALKTVVRTQTARLEAAMVAGRTWTAAAFRALFLDHPVMCRIGSTLVFQSDGGRMFRIVDGEPVDADYTRVGLAEQAIVSLAHPLDLDEQTLSTWGQHLSDAEVIQPFAQFGRPTFRADRDAGLLEGPFGQLKPAALAGRLRDHGWRNARAEDAGMVYEAHRLLGGRGVRAGVHHGGFYIGDPSWSDEPITIEGVSFATLDGQDLAPGQVDPVAFSEILYDLRRIAPG
jgi:hypothetical protein